VHSETGDSAQHGRADSPAVITAGAGAAGVITFARYPDNALTAAMRSGVGEALARWARDPEIYALLIVSQVGGAFSRGDEVRELLAWGQGPLRRARGLLADAYALLWRLDCFTKPTVSLIDGTAMGGGAALSLCGTHRVAGEGYAFALPETALGLIPGHGLSCALARMPVALGMYLAMTGAVIARADAYRLGLVTHCIAARRFADIRREIAAAEPVDQLLDAHHEDPGTGELEALQEAIARCFAAASVEEIVSRLRAEGRPRHWADAALAAMDRASPTALKITHRQVRAARAMELRACLITDFRLICRLLGEWDFHEGMRALLSGGDRPARWRPTRLEEVGADAVEAYFAVSGPHELRLASRAEMQAFRR
jgi:enoyl-CoA hydratase